MMEESILFYFFALLILLSSLFVINSRNPVHSLISLILVFCNGVIFLIFLEVDFLGMIFLVIYIGAIAVLFLFVVMMLNIKLIELNENFLKYLSIVVLTITLCIMNLLMIAWKNLITLPNFLKTRELISWSLNLNYLSNIELLGIVLYTYYFYLFILASLILLIGMIGAITLTLYQESNIKRQEIFQQVYHKLQFQYNI